MIENQLVNRYVLPVYATQYHHLMRSGLYDELVARNLLIPHTTRALTENERAIYFQVLVPEFIPVISYPYEWTPAQWKKVVLAFLEINITAVKHGMILKDATPFNFTFHKGKCVFIDTLSFDFYHDGPWIAYRQFCESMFGPLALMHYHSADWAKQLIASINGWDLSFIHDELPLRSYFNLNVLFHIHWHASYSSKAAGTHTKKTATSFSGQKLTALWAMLSKTVQRWNVSKTGKQWLAYYENGIEFPEYLDHKIDIVTKLLKEVLVDTIIDMGANNGKFSLLASEHAQSVIAVESDYGSMEQLCETIERNNISNITTIVSDITQPAPGIGWSNKERQPLLQRLKGDMVLALALIHHLCISKNIPVEFVAAVFHDMTEKYLLIEFVPKTDSKVVQMLASREDIFDDYTETGFIEKFSTLFSLERAYPINGSGRKLFLWVKK